MTTFDVVVATGGVGIGTTTPVALLHVVGVSTASQLQWNASSGSLRSGGFSGNQWSTNLGLYSTAFGFDNIAQTPYASVGGGQNNSVYSDFGYIGGGINNVVGSLGQGSLKTASTIGGGRNNTANGRGITIAGGDNNSATGSFATIVGGTDLSPFFGQI